MDWKKLYKEGKDSEDTQHSMLIDLENIDSVKRYGRRVFVSEGSMKIISHCHDYATSR